jgi:hypothetical protein
MPKNTFKVTVTSKIPASPCHPGKSVSLKVTDNPATPVWVCAECGALIERVPPENIKITPD